MSRNSSSWDQLLFQPPLCEGWKQNVEGAAYHLGNCILLLGYMGGSGIFGSIYIFSLLATGYICYALWGWLNACGLDIFIWNMLLVMACILQLAHLIYRLHKHTFLEEFDLLYKTLCQPLHVPFEVYKEIVKCCEEKVLSLARDQNYAVEGKTPINRLSLLLSGRVRVSQDGQFLHYVFPYQFLDSPEWESLRPSEEGTFQVTLTAETDCSYITWPRGGRASSWQKIATSPAFSRSSSATTSRRNCMPSTISSLLSSACALTSAYPASTTSWDPPPQRLRPRRSCMSGRSWPCPIVRCLPLSRPLPQPLLLLLLPTPRCPGLTVPCWLLEALPGVTPVPSSKDEPLWLPPRPQNSRAQQLVLNRKTHA